MLKDTIYNEMIASLKAGRKIEVQVLRFVLSEIKYAEIAKQHDLTDEEVIVVMQKEVKKRREAIELFKNNDRVPMAEDEQKQVEIIEKYLPKQMTEKEVIEIIEEAIQSSGVNPSMGAVMGIVIGKTKGRTDGKMVSDLVREKLKI